MTMSTGILLLALGAIMRFAITAEIQGIALDVVGNILMIAGAVIAVAGAIALTVRRTHRSEVYEERSPNGSRVVRERIDV